MNANMLKNTGKLFVFIFISIAFTGCSALSSNNEQRLVGTWIVQTQLDGETGTLAFSSNGTVVMKWGNDYETSFTYGAAVSKMIWIDEDGDSDEMDFYISNDGKTLILSGVKGEDILLKKK
jgi:hypothetical protein